MIHESESIMSESSPIPPLIRELVEDLHEFAMLTGRRERIEKSTRIFEKVCTRFDELATSRQCYLRLIGIIAERARSMYYQQGLSNEVEFRAACRNVIERIAEEVPGVCEPIEGEM